MRVGGPCLRKQSGSSVREGVGSTQEKIKAASNRCCLCRAVVVFNSPASALCKSRREIAEQLLPYREKPGMGVFIVTTDHMSARGVPFAFWVGMPRPFPVYPLPVPYPARTPG